MFYFKYDTAYHWSLFQCLPPPNSDQQPRPPSYLSVATSIVIKADAWIAVGWPWQTSRGLADGSTTDTGSTTDASRTEHQANWLIGSCAQAVEWFKMFTYLVVQLKLIILCFWRMCSVTYTNVKRLNKNCEKMCIKLAIWCFHSVLIHNLTTNGSRGLLGITHKTYDYFPTAQT